MKNASKITAFTLTPENASRVDAIQSRFGLPSRASTINFLIAQGHERIEAGMLTSATSVPVSSTPAIASNHAQSSTGKRGRPALTYEEKVKKRNEKNAEERAYQVTQCELYGGKVVDNTCMIPRYQVATSGALVKLEQGVPLPFCERGDFKEWAITTRYETAEEAERAYKKELQKRSRHDEERLKRAEEVALKFAELEKKRQRIAIENGWRYTTSADGIVTAERVEDEEQKSEEQQNGENDIEPENDIESSREES